MTGNIEVVGGAYGEECSFPRSVIYRGSGFRAANLLVGLDNTTTLHTVTGPDLADEFAQIAAIAGIRLLAAKGDVDIWFRYRHPLAKPDIFPPSEITPIAQGVINIKNARWKYDQSLIDPELPAPHALPYSKSYLRHLVQSNELMGARIASLQNLSFYLYLVETARLKIETGEFVFWKNEMIEQVTNRLD